MYTSVAAVGSSLSSAILPHDSTIGLVCLNRIDLRSGCAWSFIFFSMQLCSPRHPTAAGLSSRLYESLQKIRITAARYGEIMYRGPIFPLIAKHYDPYLSPAKNTLVRRYQSPKPPCFIHRFYFIL